MKVSNKMRAFLKEREGLSLKTYKDPKGKLTIGYGHTAGVKVGQTITRQRAEELLVSDIEEKEKLIDGLGLTLTPGQYDALVDFIFNIKWTEFKKSTLLKLIRQNATTADIQAQFRRWVYCEGKVLNGLVTRRNWEALRWAEAD
jgi:lysozyme